MGDIIREDRIGNLVKMRWGGGMRGGRVGSWELGLKYKGKTERSV